MASDHDGHTVNVGPVTAGITGEVDPDRLLRLYAAEVDRLRAEVLKHGDHTPACRYRRAEGDGRHCLPSCGWDTSDHDGHTIDAGPVTVGTCGCSNNFGHTCEEVARLRADNATLRDLLAKALPWIDDNDSHDDYLLTVAIREALGESLADVWDIRTLRRCTPDTGVQCWGCGRRGWRKGTDPDRWIEALCSSPDCLARRIAEGKP